MLTLEAVSAGYGPTQALRELSLTVSRGELVCLLGANGAGKSTALKTISGLVRPSRGRVVFDGEEIGGLGPPEIVRRGIAHCPEGRRVFPHLTVEENLRIGAWVRRDATVGSDLDRAFSSFPGLAAHRRQPAGTLSGGEQQMLAIGRALMSRPRLVLFDEPSLGLAPAAVEATFAVIRGVRAQGTTVLMVEQNVRLALAVADRFVALRDGLVLAQGPVSDLQGTYEDLVRRIYL